MKRPVKAARPVKFRLREKLTGQPDEHLDGALIGQAARYEVSRKPVSKKSQKYLDPEAPTASVETIRAEVAMIHAIAPAMRTAAHRKREAERAEAEAADRCARAVFRGGPA